MLIDVYSVNIPPWYVAEIILFSTGLSIGEIKVSYMRFEYFYIYLQFKCLRPVATRHFAISWHQKDKRHTTFPLNCGSVLLFVNNVHKNALAECRVVASVRKIPFVIWLTSHCFLFWFTVAVETLEVRGEGSKVPFFKVRRWWRETRKYARVKYVFLP